MLTATLHVANGDNNATPADMSAILGTNVALEDYVIAGLILPVDLEATDASLTFGQESDDMRAYKDDAGDAITIATGDGGEFVRLKASDYPFVPPFVGISLGANVTVEGGRDILLILAKR